MKVVPRVHAVFNEGLRGSTVSLSCAFCEKPFTRYVCQTKRGRGTFCSRPCFDGFQKQTGGAFKGGRHTEAVKLAISRSKAMIPSEKVERVCVTCGKPFLCFPSYLKWGKGKSCSRACADKKRSGIGIVSQDPKRRNAFNKSRRRKWIATECVRCGSTDSLQLDHIVPRYAGGKPVRENAQTLCGSCNRRKHNYEDRQKYKTPV